MAHLFDEEKIAQGPARWLCLDCDKDTDKSEEYYMLWYRIWRSINYKIDGMLCLDCVEKRLGRELIGADFSKAPINESQARRCPAVALRLARLSLTGRSIGSPAVSAERRR